MCGIVGYFGFRNAASVCKDGLEKLEYRGYDSFGIATVSQGSLEIFKETGKISAYAESINLAGTIGIGHTRWATHGVPCKKNAHPLTDSTGKIAVVHNGIIENYAELRRDLEQKGHRFSSDTDTEVIPHLIEEEFTGDLVETVRNILPKLTGSYALLIISAAYDGIVAARKGSPLAIGIGDNEIVFASDVLPISAYTNKIIYLEDGDVASVTAKNVISIYNGTETVNRAAQTIDFDIAETRKGGFPHYMLKEIYEQPDAFSHTVSSIYEHKDTIKTVFGGVHSVVITACGTSANASLIFAHLLETVCKIPTRVILASEYKYTPSPATELVIGVSQSGETADTIAALQTAKKLGAKTVAVTNVLGSSITRVADTVLYTRAGPEISVAATKTFVAQGAAFLAIIDCISGGKLKRSLSEIQRYLPEIIAEDVDDAVSLLKDSQSIIYVGRGLGYPIALEGALKMKEISYIHAEGYAAGELKHGPFALLSKEVPVVATAFASSTTYPVMMSNLKEIKAREAPLVLIGTKDDCDAEELADVFIPIPKVSDIASFTLASALMQLLAYRTAVSLGRDIDYPKNLAKSVTVE